MKLYCFRVVTNETLRIYFVYAQTQTKATKRLCNVFEIKRNEIVSIDIVG